MFHNRVRKNCIFGFILKICDSLEFVMTKKIFEMAVINTYCAYTLINTFFIISQTTEKRANGQSDQ